MKLSLLIFSFSVLADKSPEISEHFQYALRLVGRYVINLAMGFFLLSNFVTFAIDV